MKEQLFKEWLLDRGSTKKVISDQLSRIRKIENDLNIQIDEEIRIDGGERLLSLFANTGINDEMAQYETTLPIGKYHLSAYKYAIKAYINFSNSQSS